MLLTELKGIKTAREKLFNRIGIYTAEDLLNFFPHKYLDLSCESDVNSAGGTVRLCGTLTECALKYSGKHKKYIAAKADCQGKSISVIWFNQPYLMSKLISGENYVFLGQLRRENGKVSLLNPQFEKLDFVKNLKGIMPVYQSTEGLSQSTIKAAVDDLLKKHTIRSLIPDTLLQKYGLCDLFQAYKSLHMPQTGEAVEQYSGRVAVEIIFRRCLSHYLQNRELHGKRSEIYDTSDFDYGKFAALLPYTLTMSQQISIDEILGDLKSENLMNRLLMGDVGSGKTIVAFAAMYFAASCGGQCALMSPTEMLARQHYKNAVDIFERAGIRVQFLGGSQTKAERDTALFNIKHGNCGIVIGTHSIISESVQFSNLRLVVCDEQQRFGVRQRHDLAQKSKGVDMLTMTATPVPRTLSLALFGELSVSTLRERPAVSETQTNIVPASKLADMYSFVKKHVESGRQVYIVGKNIDPENADETESVILLYKTLTKGYLAGIKCGLLHGNLPAAEKERVMANFLAGDISVLISTTMIEVGIDVKNANIMIIYHADKFGLSQLHQLRGRVGRGGHDSYCFLLAENYTEDGRDRLLALKEHSDGYLLAEKDLEMRGAGDFLSLKQHGSSLGYIKNLNVTKSALNLAMQIYRDAVEMKSFTDSFTTIESDNLQHVILN